MHSEIKIDVSTTTPSEVFQFHNCDETFKINCSDGTDTWVQKADNNRMKFSNLRGTTDAIVQIDLKAAANNPCFR